MMGIIKTGGKDKKLYLLIINKLSIIIKCECKIQVSWWPELVNGGYEKWAEGLSSKWAEGVNNKWAEGINNKWAEGVNKLTMVMRKCWWPEWIYEREIERAYGQNVTVATGMVQVPLECDDGWAWWVHEVDWCTSANDAREVHARWGAREMRCTHRGARVEVHVKRCTRCAWGARIEVHEVRCTRCTLRGARVDVHQVRFTRCGARVEVHTYGCTRLRCTSWCACVEVHELMCTRWGARVKVRCRRGAWNLVEICTMVALVKVGA